MAQQNHQQPYQNIVVQEEIKEDINAFWPVFGRETSHGKQTSFWQKDPQDDLDEEEWDMEGTLSRIGRKQKDVKNYYYKLCGDYLCYYVNKESLVKILICVNYTQRKQRCQKNGLAY
ncbi:hypothetical protein PPERSA_12722 [Pseudocohnilembus persalinus]|uniref:Uncharacterized protein n=1 Tax=Pseudocohnilembus persalinus TaxID=266149 RepID=A0A0V0QUB7_PSEPJ|nr:hypothetical protein PPERSA_12722 [Pseudocohnilembus persalinus]|eukprot:KRX05544.1 hypothetical protein PPERSA_12722 [Pseudocohnilembus persalinus]